MTRLMIGLLSATAALALASPASARDGQVYVGLGAGIGTAEDTEFNDSDGGLASLDTDLGWEGEGVIGYDAGPVRIELEGAYKSFDLSSLDAGTIGVPSGLNSDNSYVYAFGTYDANGKVEVMSGMVNALLDFGDEDALTFSVGGGIGVSRVNFSDVTAFANSPGFLQDDDARFSWQGIAQVRAPLTDRIDTSVKYKYHRVDSLDVSDSNNRVFNADFVSHSVLGTIIFNFGGRTAVPPSPPPPTRTAPLPPPPAPPAPPPPPAAAPCNQGPYIVFFDWDSADITPEAATVLNSALTAYGDCGTARVMLAGHTDRSGTVAYNQGLAERRNASVRAYMTGRGVPVARISSEAFGESMPRVPTADGVRELQNRRVEITYGPGSGS
ncbi:OmpA family protein [Aurantiacibacter spongiae]|uniref:OmpA family protein n=1 Tax=Aurantiacibacter spongiae TaxID=2488860 RepID=A0A3N5CW78_9SPHN|nr:OmpA family protein [Aurantiacibacter spongiae]RPF72576.1 OmpA family protein [Aurantiacibacter spongiae]